MKTDPACNHRKSGFLLPGGGGDDLVCTLACNLADIAPLCEKIQSHCDAGFGGISPPSSLGADINLVLSELLTNIVLHACGSKCDGRIEVRARFGETALELLIIDDGVRLPPACLEPKALEINSNEIAALPEGGFGWNIVHQIIDVIDYQRIDGRNWLRLKKNVAPVKPA